MDNSKLAALSSTFTDDSNCQIDKRCICLILGERAETNAFAVSASINIFDEPQVKKKVDARAQLYHVIVEMCPENLKSLTQLVPEFTALFRYSDLSVLQESTVRGIKLKSSLYVLKQKVFNPRNLMTNEQVNKLLQEYCLKKQN